MFIVSVPLVMGWIKMNRWYGIRLPKSFKSNENWYRINKVGGWWMICASIVLMYIGSLQYLGVIPSDMQTFIIVQAVNLIIVIIPLIAVTIYSRRL
ncbi:MAG: SdpI family protein [Ignavibacteriaceae bacterium]|nr:SdpI family protein [Ignavibacteriaceae bacterium]